jgi:hypothetical protein
LSPTQDLASTGSTRGRSSDRSVRRLVAEAASRRTATGTPVRYPGLRCCQQKPSERRAGALGRSTVLEGLKVDLEAHRDPILTDQSPEAALPLPPGCERLVSPLPDDRNGRAPSVSSGRRFAIASPSGCERDAAIGSDARRSSEARASRASVSVPAHSRRGRLLVVWAGGGAGCRVCGDRRWPDAGRQLWFGSDAGSVRQLYAGVGRRR